VAVDSSGNVYVADYGNSTIRKVTPAGAVTTLAGLAGNPGSANGTGSNARFDSPFSVAVDSMGNVYVADSFNATIRKITPAGGVTTLAGLAGSPGSADGTGSAARFASPQGVAMDSLNNVYVADFYNDTIRKVTPAGVVTTLAGLAGNGGGADGTGNAARFSYPNGVAVDSAGNVYVADSGNNTIRKGTQLRLQFDTSAGSLAVSNGFFQMRLGWPFSTNVVVEASFNFQTWTPVQTNALISGVLDLSVPLGANQNQFFRARLAPSLTGINNQSKE
jgi:sugar lactone lactonase YvrE